MKLEEILKYLIYIGVAVLLYVPFIVANGMFFPYITGKGYTFRLITELIIALWLVLVVVYPIYRPRKSWILYAFGAFGISLFFSNLFGINQVASFWSNYERMEGWVTIVHLFGLFVALGSVLQTKKEWIWLFNASIVASLFMVLSAIGEISDYAATALGIENGAFSLRVDTTFGNSTYLGIYMLINAFLSIFMFFRTIKERIDWGNWRIYFYSIAFLLQTWIVFQTGTRGSMLGLLGGLILMSGLMIYFNKENKTLRKVSIWVLGGVLAFVALIFIFRDTALIENIRPLHRITHITLSEGTTQARITNWQIATQGVKENPILGWGQSNFNYVFDKHYLPKHYGNEVWFDRVHNIFFDWLIAGGILGLLFYLSIWLALVWAIFKATKFNNNEKAILISMLAAYFFHNLFVFDQIVSYIYFVFILAFVYSQTSTEYPIFKKELTESTKNIVVAVILILLPITMYAVNYQSYKANKELMQAVVLVKQTPEGQVLYNHPNGLADNINYYKKAIERDTFGTSEIRERALMMVGEVIRIQNLDNNEIKSEYINFATQEMQKHIEKYPNNSRYPYMLGSVFFQINQPELAEQNMLRAIELSPNKQYVRQPLISLYAYTDQGEKALALARETWELDRSKDALWIVYAKVASKFDKELFNRLINESIESGNIGRVENMLVENIYSNPDSVQNRISLAAFYFQAGLKEKSIEVLDDTIKSFPDSKTELEKFKKQIESGDATLGSEIDVKI